MNQIRIERLDCRNNGPGNAFITHRRVQRVAARHGLRAEFRRGLLAHALRRLNTDPEFAKRHAGPVALIGKTALALGAGAALDRLPARLATPMCFELTRT